MEPRTLTVVQSLWAASRPSPGVSSHQSLSSPLTARPGGHLTFLTVGQRQLLEVGGWAGARAPRSCPETSQSMGP